MHGRADNLFAKFFVFHRLPPWFDAPRMVQIAGRSHRERPGLARANLSRRLTADCAQLDRGWARMSAGGGRRWKARVGYPRASVKSAAVGSRGWPGGSARRAGLPRVARWKTSTSAGSSKMAGTADGAQLDREWTRMSADGGRRWRARVGYPRALVKSAVGGSCGWPGGSARHAGLPRVARWKTSTSAGPSKMTGTADCAQLDRGWARMSADGGKEVEGQSRLSACIGEIRGGWSRGWPGGSARRAGLPRVARWKTSTSAGSSKMAGTADGAQLDREWTRMSADGGRRWKARVGYPRASVKSAVAGSAVGRAVRLGAQACPGWLGGKTSTSAGSSKMAGTADCAQLDREWTRMSADGGRRWKARSVIRVHR